MSIATQTTASGVLCWVVMVGQAPFCEGRERSQFRRSSADHDLLAWLPVAALPPAKPTPPRSSPETTCFRRCYGSEFVNWHLKAWCAQKQIQLTRGRPYKKDDNAHVEQKNWTHVRKLLGWDRYDSPAAVQAINDLYRQELRLWLNLYLPSVKLIRKVRVGSKLRRFYDAPQTPFQRVQACSQADPARVAALQALLKTLDPFRLAQVIDHKLQRIYGLTNRRLSPKAPRELAALSRKRGTEENGCGKHAEPRAWKSLRDFQFPTAATNNPSVRSQMARQPNPRLDSQRA